MCVHMCSMGVCIECLHLVWVYGCVCVCMCICTCVSVRVYVSECVCVSVHVLAAQFSPLDTKSSPLMLSLCMASTPSRRTHAFGSVANSAFVEWISSSLILCQLMCC